MGIYYINGVLSKLNCYALYNGNQMDARKIRLNLNLNSDVDELTLIDLRISSLNRGRIMTVAPVTILIELCPNLHKYIE